MPTTMSTTPDLRRHLEEYRELGYTIFPGFWSLDEMAAFAEEGRRLERLEHRRMFRNNLERNPGLMWPAIQRLLGSPVMALLEHTIGPLVQLDSLNLKSTPPVDRSQHMRPIGWHRDMWAEFPTGVYRRPLAGNMIAYGQELNEDFGPLRVIPGSHIQPVRIEDDMVHEPHPDEVLVRMGVGDLVVTHNGLLHSGTHNTADRDRFFFSFYVNSCWLKTTDSFAGPECQRLIAEARAAGDRQLLRFLGSEPQLDHRNNWGFRVPEEERYAQWRAEERREQESAQ